MIRYINCFRKKDGLSDDEFRHYWCSEDFNNLVREIVELTKASRHAKNLTLGVEATNRIISDRGMCEPYDAVLEYWWPNAHELMPLYETPVARELFARMEDYQRQFIDLAGSTAFFTEHDQP